MTWQDLITTVEHRFLSNLSVSSWVRSPEHNRKVGGVPNSKHLTGEAIDVVWDAIPSEADLRTWLYHRGFKLVRERDHDHIEWMRAGEFLLEVPVGRPQ